ncbi:uncharacterized protein G2W53_031688 [Senna tora]|uniref:Uncharacterized protein n=1 Tax=Senna tora TaxID=362788 RepID=A0A834T980_9FABA|nr:uncharacterized protein G2W53_031688 [Senna tora]
MVESGASNSPFSGRGSSTKSSQGSGSTRKSRITDGDQSSESSLESFLGHLSHVPTLNGVTFVLNKLPFTTERDNEFVDPSLGPDNAQHYQVLIEESPVESQHTMIVVGQTLKGKISNRIHRYATVPAAEPAECLAQVIFALEAKFFLDTDSIFFCEKN